MDIMDLMKILGNTENIENIGGSEGVETDQVKHLLDMAIPTIMKAMDRNARSPMGAESLINALKEHENKDVVSMIKNPSKIDKNDGEKILSHILSSKDDQVKNNLARETGLGKKQVSGVLAQLAPILMGVLGQQQKQGGLNGLGISSILSEGLSKASKGGMLDMATKFLDQDNDGSIVDDIGNIIGDIFKK